MTDDKKDGKSPRRQAIDYSVLQGAIGYQLRLAQLKVFSDFIASFEELQLRPADFSTLLLMSANPGLKMRELAEALGIQRANFVAMADMLERRGLAERRKSETDRRIQRFFLTAEGRAFVSKMMITWKEHEDRLVEALGGTEQRDQLLNLLGRILKVRPREEAQASNS